MPSSEGEGEGIGVAVMLVPGDGLTEFSSSLAGEVVGLGVTCTFDLVVFCSFALLLMV